MPTRERRERGSLGVALALALTVVSAGCDGCENPFARAPERTDRMKSALEERARTAPSWEAARRPPEPDPLNTKSESPEGASSAEEVYSRAQRAFEEKDFDALVHSIRPDARRRWVHDVAVEVAFESIDTGSEPDLGRRRAQAEARGILLRFGASAMLDRKADISLEEIDRKLFERVRDPDGLLVILLALADEHGCGVDPPCALSGNGLDGVVRPDESRLARPHAHPTIETPGASAASRLPSASAVGLVRLIERIRSPHRLQEVKDGPESFSGMTEAPDFEPVQFYREGGVVWLDES